MMIGILLPVFFFLNRHNLGLVLSEKYRVIPTYFVELRRNGSYLKLFWLTVNTFSTY